jgi:hypothetical protein
LTVKLIQHYRFLANPDIKQGQSSQAIEHTNDILPPDFTVKYPSISSWPYPRQCCNHPVTEAQEEPASKPMTSSTASLTYEMYTEMTHVELGRISNHT